MMNDLLTAVKIEPVDGYPNGTRVTITDMETGAYITWEILDGRNKSAFRLIYEAFSDDALDGMFTAIQEGAEQARKEAGNGTDQ